MASGNRVEELETRIRELEATVTGLTDELLECKQRLDELEEQSDIDDGSIDSTEEALLSSSGEIDRNNTDEDESNENTDLDGDEIIVA